MTGSAGIERCYRRAVSVSSTASGGVRLNNGSDVVETEAIRYSAGARRADTDVARIKQYLSV